MVHEVDIHELAAARTAGAMILDVREPEEYVNGHVPGAVSAPMSALQARLADLPADGRVFVICASGARSTMATAALAAAGVDAVSVAGGTNAWIRAGRPVVRGPRADAA